MKPLVHLLMLGAGTLAGSGTAQAVELLVPAYFYPGTHTAQWQQLTDTAARQPLSVIINPDNGAGQDTQLASEAADQVRLTVVVVAPVAVKPPGALGLVLSDLLKLLSSPQLMASMPITKNTPAKVAGKNRKRFILYLFLSLWSEDYRTWSLQGSTLSLIYRTERMHSVSDTAGIQWC